MGKKQGIKPDTALRDFWRNDERFAGLFNQALFGGDEAIRGENLTNDDTDESAVIRDGARTTSISRRRDNIKRHDDGTILVLLGVEDQMHVHYAFPVRTMLYDALKYTKQCKDIENRHRNDGDLAGSDEFLSGMRGTDRIKPVISLVLYYGEKDWDGATRLSDMVELAPPYREYFNDYKINLVQAGNAGGYGFRNRDNMDFFTMLGEFYSKKGRMDTKSFQKKYADRDVYWETLVALGAVTGSQGLVEYANKYKGGYVNMCTALKSLEEQSERKGELRGERRGERKGEIKGEKKSDIKNIQRIIAILKELGVDNDTIRQKVAEKFQLTDSEVGKYLAL